MKLSEANNLSDDQKTIRMNIRNAFLAESVPVIRQLAVLKAGEGRWFEVAVLLELALDD